MTVNNSLKQTGIVSEFLEQFEHLSHGILLYNPSYDDTYFVTQFLGGLCKEVRSAIALHCPKNVQEASSLALLQEAELETRSRRHVKEFGQPSFKSSAVLEWAMWQNRQN